MGTKVLELTNCSPRARVDGHETPSSPVRDRPGTRLARYARSFLNNAHQKCPREVQITAHFDMRVAFVGLSFLIEALCVETNTAKVLGRMPLLAGHLVLHD
jgi:hypothetical protein